MQFRGRGFRVGPADIPLRRRLLSPANVFSVVAGVTVFFLGVVAWSTNSGVIAAAAAGAIATGVVWLIWWYATGSSDLHRLLGRPRLGSIPNNGTSPAPTLIDAMSTSSKAYRSLFSEIERRTNGQVLLISSPTTGQGASTVALNLAVSGTQRGRRIALIDGDTNGDGVSRFLSTGSEPGLTDLADGTSTLADASRLWTIAPESALPVVPSGSSADLSEIVLAGPELADAIDRIAEHADILFIDTPPITRDSATTPLAAHADGTILVVANDATGTSVVEARDRLATAGAPVIGYVENRSKPPSFWRVPYVRMLKRIAATFVVIALVYSGFTGYRIYRSWAGLGRETLATSEAADALPSTSVPLVANIEHDPELPALEDIVIAAPTIEGAYQSLLLIGSDEAATLADVVLLTVLPADEDLAPFMVSLPRDLYVPNRCEGGYGRINATYAECGGVNAPTMLALAVEDFTGIKVDNFAIFDFEGFEQVIDGIGGIEICSEYPLRDRWAQLDFPGGCVNADGALALSWIRSRKTQHFVDGGWSAVPGRSDFLRNQHQQDVLIQLAKQLRSFESPADLSSKIEELSNAFIIDDGLGIADAIALAWSMREIDVETIQRLVVPVKYGRTILGQEIVRATQPFDEVLAEFYPELLADETGTASSTS